MLTTDTIGILGGWDGAYFLLGVLGEPGTADVADKHSGYRGDSTSP